MEMEALENEEENEDEEDENSEDAAAMDVKNILSSRKIALDILIRRYEDVVERRPILLSSVMLRQNPHNVKVIDSACD
tara:strand:- start:775 stop:1008 length:234 start_codon:yes stop_codon:yes gene_type:complete